MKITYKKEAIQAMLDGLIIIDAVGKLYHFSTDDDEFRYKGNEKSKWVVLKEITNSLCFSPFQIYQEPKKKLKFYRYLDNESNKYEELRNWYSDCGKCWQVGQIIESPPYELWRKIHGAYIEVEV